MATPFEKLVRKGMKQPSPGLVQLARYLQSTAAPHKAKFVARGFTEAKFAELATKTELVCKGISNKVEKWDLSYAATAKEAELIQKCKQFSHTARRMLPTILRDADVPGLDETSLNDGKLEASTPRLIEHLATIRPTIVALEEPLKPYFEGQSPTALLDGFSLALQEADQAQEVARKAAPDATAELRATKGRLLELCEDLIRVASLVFYGNAEMIGKFNKDILLRARRSQTGADPASPSVPEVAA